jgi:hypothetical protein
MPCSIIHKVISKEEQYVQDLDTIETVRCRSPLKYRLNAHFNYDNTGLHSTTAIG